MKAANFLKLLIKQGGKAFVKIKGQYHLDGIDVNDLYDLSQWIKGSVTNDNLPEDELPQWTYDFLKEIDAI